MLSKISKSSLKRPSYHYLSNNEPNRLLGHYLAGLIEGDGSTPARGSSRIPEGIPRGIVVPKTITLRALLISLALGCFARNPKGKNFVIFYTY